MGDSAKPLNKQFCGQLVRDGSLIRVEIPASCFDQIEDFLRTIGLGSFAFMPDLEGLRNEHEARTAQRLRETEEFMPMEFRRE